MQIPEEVALEKTSPITLQRKKTKIVATIGPATEQIDSMRAIVKAGMNVARLNFSHGNYEEHALRVKNARLLSQELKTPIAVLQDLSGPKIRIGEIEGEKVELKKGEAFTLTTTPCKGSGKKVWVSYEKLSKEVKAGGVIFLRDGRVKLQVNSVSGNDIHCIVSAGGEIKSKAGVNVPGAYLSIPCLTEKDRKDLQFGLDQDVDFMALSFVRKASDVIELKEIIQKAKKDIKVVAKIETQEAIENLDEIIAEAHSVMVARGDLATEMPAEQVPILQKMIVRKCNMAGKPVIVATQMLESMIHSSVPTRAEVNDIANAILDGTDAIMLSEETTLGKHPELAVQMMSAVALHTENNFPYEDFLKREHLTQKSITDSVSCAAATVAHEVNAKAIIALTLSGYTARMISRYKSERPIVVITPNAKTYNQAALKFNCYPLHSTMFQGLSDSLANAKNLLLSHKFCAKGDTVVVIGGIPFEKSGNTNTIFVQTID